MREGTSIHEALLGIELFEISSNFIYKLRQSHPNPERVFQLLPTYCLNDSGNIRIAEYHHQFIGTIESEENTKFLYFNLNTVDSLLLEEAGNVGFEDFFEENLDFNKILSKFVPQCEIDINNFVFSNVNYVVIEITYITSYDHEGGYDSDVQYEIKKFLDNNFQLQQINAPKFKKGDKVKLPYNETGTIVRYHELVWGSRYDVKIRKSNGFNDTNEVVDFFEKDLKLEIKIK